MQSCKKLLKQEYLHPRYITLGPQVNIRLHTRSYGVSVNVAQLLVGQGAMSHLLIQMAQEMRYPLQIRAHLVEPTSTSSTCG